MFQIANSFGAASSELGSGGTGGDEYLEQVANLCFGTDGWVGTTAAECGLTASFSECTSSGTTCVRNHGISKRQQCH